LPCGNYLGKPSKTKSVILYYREHKKTCFAATILETEVLEQNESTNKIEVATIIGATALIDLHVKPCPDFSMQLPHPY